MVSSPFICGSAKFHSDSDEEYIHSADSSPRRCRIRSFNNHKKNNPYASRGLDKFSALLAEIQERREKIYSELGEDEISFVQFKFSNDGDNDIKPIVVRLKDNKTKDDQVKSGKKTSKQTCKDNNNNKKKQPRRSKSGPLDTSHRAAPGTSPVLSMATSPRAVKASKEIISVEDEKTKTKEKNPLGKLKLDRLRKPRYYLAAIVIMILLFLVMFGRSVAILCTSISWYLIPTITNGSSSSLMNRRKSFQKKDNIVDKKPFKMGNTHHRLQGLASFKGHDR